MKGFAKKIKIMVTFLLLYNCIFTFTPLKIQIVSGAPTISNITPINGTILNDYVHDVNVSADDIQFWVNGSYSDATSLTINGRSVPISGGSFSIVLNITVPLKNYFNFSLYKSSTNQYYNLSYIYYYDRNTVKRYCLVIDDFGASLRDVDANSPATLWDNDEFGWMKDMHDTYGTKFLLMLLYWEGYDIHASSSSWSLASMTDAYKSDFQSASDWLKFGFHAYAYRELMGDYDGNPSAFTNVSSMIDTYWDLMRDEVVRFAGWDSWTNKSCRPHVLVMDFIASDHVIQSEGMQYLITDRSYSGRPNNHCWWMDMDDSVTQYEQQYYLYYASVDYLRSDVPKYNDYDCFFITSEYSITPSNHPNIDSKINSDTGVIMDIMWHDYPDYIGADGASQLRSSSERNWVESNYISKLYDAGYESEFYFTGFIGNTHIWENYTNTSSSENLNFTDICGLGNRSDISVFDSFWANCSVPTANNLDNIISSQILEISEYELRVAEDSSFSELITNETSSSNWFNISADLSNKGSMYFDYRVKVKVVTS